LTNDFYINHAVSYKGNFNQYLGGKVGGVVCGIAAKVRDSWSHVSVYNSNFKIYALRFTEVELRILKSKSNLK
jgi:hypothetical protein